MTDVQRKDGTAVHTTNKPLTVESNVKVVIDWTRRWDHMQHHTGWYNSDPLYRYNLCDCSNPGSFTNDLITRLMLTQ